MYGKYTKVIAVATVAVAVAALVIGGCGGGGGGGTPANLGHVTGRIVELVSYTGIGGMQVTIGGRSGTSNERDGGAFTVRNIPPGSHQVYVTPTEFFAPVGDIPAVPVTAGQTYSMGKILVVDPSYQDPPDEP